MNLYKIDHIGDTPEKIDFSSISEIIVGPKSIPIIGTGAELRARQTAQGVVLVRGDFDPEERCLVVVVPQPWDVKELNEVAKINARIRARGEVLFIFSKYGSFRLDSKDGSYYYDWKTEDTKEDWTVESRESRRVSLAILSAERDEGEWL